MIEAREDVSQALAVLRSIDYKKRISIELRRKYTLLYNGKRIYGIDIARYQHEKGRRRYKIDWKNLRVTSLGSISKQKSSGKEQAAYFLSVAKITKNDFPPVLDIEPSAGQIAAMGGTEALFKAVRTWLNIVEQRTGHRPILYISQMFVRKYLDDAPDLKKKYQVWIARYGEYRPDVRLLFWQLCPDGRVSGIVPQVDINVFNGDREQFEEYVRNSTNR